MVRCAAESESEREREREREREELYAHRYAWVLGSAHSTSGFTRLHTDWIANCTPPGAAPSGVKCDGRKEESMREP